MNFEKRLSWVLGVALVFIATSIGTNAAPSGPDLELEMKGTNRPYVYTPYVYRAKVRNVGTSHAKNVTVTVDLPISANSPTQYVLGRISSIDPKCSLVNNRLECNFGRVKAGKAKTAKFTFVHPVSTRTLSFTGTAAVTGDTNAANNSDTKTLNPRYQDLIITGPVNVINQHCTGSTSLSSFYECVLAPTSVTDHPTTLNADGSITFQVPGYTGSWFQPSNKELKFSYVSTNANQTVLNFHGYAVSANCFEGLSTFPTNTSYVSPYKVCIQ